MLLRLDEALAGDEAGLGLLLVVAGDRGADALLLPRLLAEGLLQDLVDGGPVAGLDAQDPLDEGDLFLVCVGAEVPKRSENMITLRISLSTSSGVLPAKGALPSIISKSRMPSAQMSIFSS